MRSTKFRPHSQLLFPFIRLWQNHHKYLYIYLFLPWPDEKKSIQPKRKYLFSVYSTGGVTTFAPLRLYFGCGILPFPFILHILIAMLDMQCIFHTIFRAQYVQYFLDWIWFYLLQPFKLQILVLQSFQRAWCTNTTTTTNPISNIYIHFRVHGHTIMFEHWM